MKILNLLKAPNPSQDNNRTTVATRTILKGAWASQTFKSLLLSSVFMLALGTVSHWGSVAVADSDHDRSTPAISSQNWPQWRGPDRLNASRETGLLQNWPSNGPPLLWIATGLGEGITAMAVADGQAYTLGYRDGGEYVFALDAASGESRWTTRLQTTSNPNSNAFSSVMRWLSPRVPTVDADRVYTITAAGDLTCLGTKNGEVLWRKNYADDFQSKTPTWGYCDYPLVDGEALICTPCGPDATVAALNKRNGELLWKTTLPDLERKAHAATVVSTAGGLRHYVAFLQKGLTGIATDSGRVLWRYGKTVGTHANSYTPIVWGDFVFSVNGYGGGMALLKLARKNDSIIPLEQYHRSINFNPFQDSTVLVGDFVCAILGAGQLVCIEMQSGKLVWEQAGPYPQRRAALIYADGHIYVRRSDGSMSLVEATPKSYMEKGYFQIPNPEEVSGVTFPVVSGGRLYLRDNNRLLCYDIRADAGSKPSGAPKAVEVSLMATPAALPESSRPPSRIGMSPAPDAIFVPTPIDIVEKMLDSAALTTNSILYDLGSGDGRIVIAAARKYGCQAVGYEIDSHLVELSRAQVRSHHLEPQVRIEQADFFKIDLSGADVIAVYLPTNLLERLRPQFDKLKPGARIVSHQFPILGAQPKVSLDLISREDGDRHRIFLWTTPLD